MERRTVSGSDDCRIGYASEYVDALVGRQIPGRPVVQKDSGLPVFCSVERIRNRRVQSRILQNVDAARRFVGCYIEIDNLAIVPRISDKHPHNVHWHIVDIHNTVHVWREMRCRLIIAVVLQISALECR